MADEKKKPTKKDLTKLAKEQALKNAKLVRGDLEKEYRKYKNAAKKQSKQTAKFYERAAELVKKESSKYTQRAIRSQFGKDAAINEKLLAEAAFLRSFKGGNVATNVARRILSTRAEDEAKGMLQTSQAGARFYSGLINVWYTPGLSEEEQAKAYKERDKKIIQFFGKKNLLQVIEEIENKLGIDLLNMLSDPEKYEEARNAIQSYVSSNQDRLIDVEAL